MAVTKIHPIKATLKSALDYIMDPEKTDEEILISSHGCGHQTAYLEFENTRQQWNSSVKNLARHFIQSFDPDDHVSAETAHEIGLQFMEQSLQGKFEYVLCTHVDKDHVHNHIIWNNVSFVDGKAYQSNKKSYRKLRQISDDLCKDYGLRVLESESKMKGKSYKEYAETKRGKSWKKTLKYAIDNAIKRAKDWEDFLRIMKSFGYEIKEGKHISFRAKDQKRFTRAKTIGDYYTEDRIKERIQNKNSITHLSKKDMGLGQIIDIKNNEKAQSFKGYEMWAKQHNIKNIAKTLQMMSELKIGSVHDLYEEIQRQSLDLTIQSRKVKAIELEIKTLAKKGKDMGIYKKYKKLYESYEKSTNKAEIYRANVDKIILFESAKTSLGNDFNENELGDLSQMKNKIKELSLEKSRELEQYNIQKSKLSELELLRKNLETYMEWQHLDLQHNKNIKMNNI